MSPRHRDSESGRIFRRFRRRNGKRPSADLKGADYDKKLVWRTDEGLRSGRTTGARNRAGLAAQTEPTPGEFPFVRGTGKAWEFGAGDALPESAIRADAWHEAGAHAVQELATRWRRAWNGSSARPAGQTVDDAAQAIEFVFAAGPDLFRGDRQVARGTAAVGAGGGGVRAGAARQRRPHAALRAHGAAEQERVRSATRNLLRVTTEALAAVIGGCDRLAGGSRSASSRTWRTTSSTFCARKRTWARWPIRRAVPITSKR